MTNLKLTPEEEKAILEARAAKKTDEELREESLINGFTKRIERQKISTEAGAKRTQAIKDQFIKSGISENEIEITTNRTQKVWMSDDEKEVAKKYNLNPNRIYGTFSLKVHGYRMSIEGTKVMNESITGRWGYYLVKSMAKKVLDKIAADKAKVVKAETDKDKAYEVYNDLLKKYKNVSNSFITLEAGRWSSYGGSGRGYRMGDFYKIALEFKSGSELTFEVRMWQDKFDLKLISKIDAQYKKLETVEEWAEKFNNQK